MKFLGAVAVRAVLPDLLDRFASQDGIPVAAEYDLNPVVARRLLAGEAFDVATTNPAHVAELVAAGCVEPGSDRPLGRIPLAVGGRAGVEAPGDLAGLLNAAGRIAYTGEGTSGKTYLAMLAQLGFRHLVQRSVPMGAGQPVRAVAAGEADLAVAPLTVLIATEGVTPLAAFPSGHGADIAMAVFPTRRAADPERAGHLAAFLANPRLDATFAERGVLRG